MKTVRLGRTGLEVSRVGMGGIPITRPPLEMAIQVINRALDLGVNFIDTASRARMPCPQGVNIWMLMITQGMFRLWPRERLVTGWFADATETAKDCVQCGECEPKCPYNLPIREMIKENYEFFRSRAERN